MSDPLQSDYFLTMKTRIRKLHKARLITTEVALMAMKDAILRAVDPVEHLFYPETGE